MPHLENYKTAIVAVDDRLKDSGYLKHWEFDRKSLHYWTWKKDDEDKGLQYAIRVSLESSGGLEVLTATFDESKYTKARLGRIETGRIPSQQYIDRLCVLVDDAIKYNSNMTHETLTHEMHESIIGRSH